MKKRRDECFFTYFNSFFFEVCFLSKFFSGCDVRIMTPLEVVFQNFQLFLWKDGSVSSLSSSIILCWMTVYVWICTCNKIYRWMFCYKVQGSLASDAKAQSHSYLKRRLTRVLMTSSEAFSCANHFQCMWV